MSIQSIQELQNSDVMRRMLVVVYGHFFNCCTHEDGTNLDCFTLEDRTDMLSRIIDTSIPNYQPKLHNNREGRKHQLRRGGRFKCRRWLQVH